MARDATITATTTPGDPIPVIQLDVTIGDAPDVTSWTIYRDAPGASTPIFIGATSSGAISLVDYEAPLGVPVLYRIVVVYVDYGQITASSAPVIITGTIGCYLTTPATGATIRVELSAWPSRMRAARQSTINVLSRPDPVGLVDVHSTPAGQWTFVTRTDVATAELIAMLTDMAVVVLRTQPLSSIATCTALVGDITERRYSSTGGDQRRLVDVAIQEIAPLPATALPLAATLGGLAIYDGDTLGELSMLRPTLLQLSMIVTG